MYVMYSECVITDQLNSEIAPYIIRNLDNLEPYYYLKSSAVCLSHIRQVIFSYNYCYLVVTFT
jgi:hypothetical protein